MKAIFPFFIALLIMLTFGCGSKDWENELNVLLQKEAQLHELYRNGELSESDYSNSVFEVSQSSLEIINRHKKKLFQNHVDALQESGVSSEIIDLIPNSSAEKHSVESMWDERHSGDELIRMNPKGLTHMVLSRQLSLEEYKSLLINAEPVHLLEISRNTCTTAMLSSNTIYTVSFTKGNYCWTPIEYHKYKIN